MANAKLTITVLQTDTCIPLQPPGGTWKAPDLSNGITRQYLASGSTARLSWRLCGVQVVPDGTKMIAVWEESHDTQASYHAWVATDLDRILNPPQTGAMVAFTTLHPPGGVVVVWRNCG